MHIKHSLVTVFATLLTISAPVLSGALPQAAAQGRPDTPSAVPDQPPPESAPTPPTTPPTKDEEFPIDAGGDIVDRVLDEADSLPDESPDGDRPPPDEPTDKPTSGASTRGKSAGGAAVKPGDPQTDTDEVQVIDFGEEEEGPSVEMMTAQDPTPLKHKSLIRKKFRGPAPGGVAAEQLVEVPSRWSAGVQLGGSLVNFAGIDMAEASPAGAGLGVFGEFRAAPLLAIRPEARVSWQGALADNAGVATRLYYVQVPVVVAANLSAGRSTVSVGAGPALGVSLRSAIGTAELQRFVMSALVDASARTRIGAREWLLAARYEHGLSNLVQSADQLVDIRTRVLSLGVGVLF